MVLPTKGHIIIFYYSLYLIIPYNLIIPYIVLFPVDNVCASKGKITMVMIIKFSVPIIKVFDIIVLCVSSIKYSDPEKQERIVSAKLSSLTSSALYYLLLREGFILKKIKVMEFPPPLMEIKINDSLF